jgi:dTDP-4-amino-4,6-dideoxygalactose transaminase
MKVPFLDLSLQHRALREPALAALAATYDATRFCLGKDVEDFEKTFGARLGYPRVLGMNSGTSPLHIACMIAGFGPGDEIITSPFTFISTAWGINYVGATPVFADIEEGTFNLDPSKLAAAVTPRTKGLIVVHLFGQPARMDEIMTIARKHNLFVIEDCAQAVGATYQGASPSLATPVGLIGDCGTFSFYPTKNLGACGEGGAFVSRREDVQTKARHIRVHGSDRRYYHDIVGGNFRMDGFQGALLNVKLPHLAQWTARRRAIAGQYLAGIKSTDVRLPDQPNYGQSVFHQFTIRHPRRDALREHLSKQDIGTDLIYPVPLHLQKCYAALGRGRGSFPIAERSADTCVSLPIFPELTDTQVDHVIKAVNSFRG